MAKHMNRVAFCAVMLAVLALTLLPLPALASGDTLSASLSFLPEVSNWGNTGATGEATVSVASGTVSLSARGLQALSTDVYEVWLVTAGLTQWVSVGRFSGTGSATDYSVAVDEIPALDYRYLVVTVEPAEGDSGEPSGRNAIAGYFSGGSAQIATPAAALAAETDSVTSVTTDSERSADDQAEAADTAADSTPPPPVYLPVSGAPLRVSVSVIAVGLVGVALGSLVLTQRR